ncbi:MAG: hypothetical protein SFU99_16220 [Saprospiraceae bacterium]|nr:hypothetical protein [Saprospiraceae bacterium]
MKKYILVGIIVCIFIGVLPLNAQDYSKDTETIESTMEAVLDVISGPAGRKMDMARFRNLFRGDIKFHIRTKRNDQLTIAELSVESYISNVAPRLEGQDFFETLGSLTVDRYGDIAQIFMVYETRRSPDGEPFDKGINSFQLMYDQGRWWVVGLMWQAESSGVPIPKKYLKSKNSKKK